MRREIVLLAISAKHHNLCVAGIDISTNSYIRLVSDDESCGNAIHKEDFRYSFADGNVPAKLSIVSVETSDYPMFCSGAQLENHLFNPSGGVHYCGKAVLNQLCFPAISSLPFNSLSNYLDSNEYAKQDHSIEVLRVHNIIFRSYFDDNEREKYKVDFMLEDNRICIGYYMTDRKFFAEGLDGMVIEEAFIVITIAGGDGVGSAKFVASILEV